MHAWVHGSQRKLAAQHTTAVGGLSCACRHLLYRPMPYDPTYHILVKFFGLPNVPSRLARALPANVNRLWLTVMSRSFPTFYKHWAQRRAAVVATPRQRQGLSKLRRRRNKSAHEEAAGWFLSTHRVTLHGFCFSVRLRIQQTQQHLAG